MCLELHGHAVVGGVADGDLVVDAVGGYEDEGMVCFQDFCNGFALADCTNGERLNGGSKGRPVIDERGCLSGLRAYT